MLLKSYTSISELAKDLIIAKGYDYNSIDVANRKDKENEILKIYFDFVDEVILSSKSSDLIEKYNQYKDSNFDFEYLQKNEALKNAFQECLEQFLKL